MVAYYILMGDIIAHIIDNPLGTFQEHPTIGKDDRKPSYLDCVDQDWMQEKTTEELGPITRKSQFLH